MHTSTVVGLESQRPPLRLCLTILRRPDLVRSYAMKRRLAIAEKNGNNARPGIYFDEYESIAGCIRCVESFVISRGSVKYLKQFIFWIVV